MSFIPNKNQNLFNFLRFSSDSQVREHETQPIELSDLSESDTNIFNIKEYCNSLAEGIAFSQEEQEYWLSVFQEASIECENNPNKESILYCNENKNDEFDAKNEQYSSADINNSSKESYVQIVRNIFGKIKEIKINDKIYDLSKYNSSRTKSGNKKYILNNSEETPYFFIHKNGDIEIRQYLDNGYYGEKYNAQGELIQIDPSGEGSAYIAVKSAGNGIYLDESGKRYYRNKDGYFEAEKGLPVTSTLTETGDTKISLNNETTIIFQGLIEENGYCKFEGTLKNGNYAKTSKDDDGNIIITEHIKEIGTIEKTISQNGSFTQITRDNSGNAKEININGKIYNLSQYTYSKTSSGNERYLLNNSEEAPYFYIHKDGNIEIRQYLDNGYYGEKYNAQGELIQIDPSGEGSAYIAVKSTGNGIYLDGKNIAYSKNENGYYKIKKGEQIDSEATKDKTTVLKINKNFSLEFDTSVKQDENGIYKGYLLNGNEATIYKNENGKTTVIQTSEHFTTTTIYSNNTYAKITKNKDNIIVEININGKLYDLSDYTRSATKNEYKCDSNDNKNNKPSFFINDYTGDIEIQQVINEEYYKEIYDNSGNLIKINPLGKGDTCYSVKPNENGIYVDKYCTEYIPNSNGLYEAHPSKLEELANYINEILNNKNDSATEEISKNVFEKINNENISTFMYWYKKNAENDIITDLFNSEILHRKEKKKLLRHITDCLIEYAESKGAYTEDISHELKKIYKGRLKDLDSLKSAVSTLNLRITMISSADDTINGEIDKNFKQGQIGDCYALAAINSIANTPNGYKILKNSIEILENNSIKVTLKGVNKEYIISQEELNYTDEYSTGDMDVRAIEIALEKHYKKSNKTIENGGRSKYILKILSGKKIDTDIIQLYSSEYEKLEEVFENLKNENFVCTASTSGKKSNTTAYEIESRKNVDIASNHEYSILYTDDKYVYIQNPWDTSKTLKMTFDEFKKSFTSVTILNLD